MRNGRRALVLSAVVFLLAGASMLSSAEPTQSQAAEQAVWKLEHSYWDYVQDNNLAAYSDLWHKDFLGWPAQSAAPVGKDHITGWITSQTAKGLVFRSGEFKPASIHATGDIVVACYWITFQWLDKDGKGDAHTLRILHAWLREGKDWRIISGMSMPEPAPLPH
jgi:ketosteroid isomerase-like protein